MVRDRLPDLLRASRNCGATFGRGFLQDVHIHIAQNKKVKQVLDQVQDVRGLIELMVDNISIVKDLHNNVLSHTDRDLQKELESRTYIVSQTAFCVQRKLRDMGKDVVAIDDTTLMSVRDSPVHLRIKVLQYKTMVQMFSDIMEEYNTLLLRYHEKCLLLLHQQRTLIKKCVTSEEMCNMLDAQEGSLFVDNILEDSRIARQQLSEIQSRHDDVLKLEKSIIEVRDMFAEMAFLIEKQGEQVNNVEYFAGKTTDNIDNGRCDLRRAEKRAHRHGTRKIKIAVIIGIIIFLFLLIIIFL